MTQVPQEIDDNYTTHHNPVYQQLYALIYQQTNTWTDLLELTQIFVVMHIMHTFSNNLQRNRAVVMYTVTMATTVV